MTSGNNLFKLDAGTLALAGTNAVESMDIDGGTNIITGNTTLNGNGVGYDRFYLGDGDTIANCSGTLIIQPGAAFSVTGNFYDSFVIGRDSGSGTVIQNGGILTFNCNQQYLWVGATSEAGTTAAYYMNGGLLDMSGNTLGIALGNGVLTTCVAVSYTHLDVYKRQHPMVPAFSANRSTKSRCCTVDGTVGRTAL